jgi:hypothetical protein
MARDNTQHPARESGSIDELLVPLRGLRAEKPTGRIRSLREARAALRVPLSDAPEVLAAWGKPPDFQLVAFAVSEPEQPELVAEFAALRVLRRHGRARAPARRDTRPSQANTTSLWIVYGSIVTNTASIHVIESLSIGPAFPGHRSHTRDSLGVTAPLLRLLSPARLLSEAIERLRRDHAELTRLENSGAAPAMPPPQREAFAKLEVGAVTQTTVSEEQTKTIAERYLTLVHLGNAHPLPQLAAEFAITRSQARDRVHKARNDGYLARGTPGSASAVPGPRLKNWSPPSIILTAEMSAEWRGYGTRVLLTMNPEDEAIYAPMACLNPRRPVANPVVYIDNRTQ